MAETSEDMRTYIEAMLEQFELDPADSDYQRGYQAALEELLRVAKEMRV